MNKQPTTEQLRKYVAGQLSRPEQYKVERAALNDPFVADALDGLMASKNTNNDLAELQSRLQKRVTPQENQRLVPWLWASAAALILSIGLGWIYLKEEQISPAVSMAMPKDEKMLPAVGMTKPNKEKTRTVASMPKLKKDDIIALVTVNKAEDINASTAEEMVVPAEGNAVRAEVESIKKDKTIDTANPASVAVTMEAEDVLPAANANMKRASSMSARAAPLKTIEPNQITTRGIIRAADGSALPGVMVNVTGTNRGINTDINGTFSLDKIQVGDRLSFSQVGFDTKEIIVKDSTTQQIILQENGKALSEVVVTGYDRKAKKVVKKAARKAKRKQKK
jgi:hypothetical protein